MISYTHQVLGYKNIINYGGSSNALIATQLLKQSGETVKQLVYGCDQAPMGPRHGYEPKC